MMPRFTRFVLGYSLALGLSTTLGCFPTQSSVIPAEPKKAKATAIRPTIDARYAALPRPGAKPEFTPPQATKAALSNGLSLWHMKHDNAPLVSIHLMLNVGSAKDPQGKEGLTMMAADLLDEGAGSLNALELSDRLGELATDYSSSAGIDYVLLSMNGLAENLEASLELLAAMVQRPRLDKREFERRKEHHLTSALSSRDDPHDARSRALASALFGGDYAGRPPNGTLTSIQSITHADVKSHVKTIAVPDGAHLIVAGAVEVATLEKLAQKYFGSWSGKSPPMEPKLSDEPEGNIAYVVDFKGATQSSLAVARRAGSDGDPNYFAEEVMNDRLGGSFTGRINMNLREDKGYTYGAQSLFRRYHYAGYFGIFSDVISESTAASVKEVFNELNAVCKDHPLSDVERNESVEGMLLGYVMDFAETESVGLRLASLPLRDRPVDFWTTWPNQVSQVTTARANEAARPFCDSNQFSVVIAGDQATLTPQLEELGLKVVGMDHDGHPLN